MNGPGWPRSSGPIGSLKEDRGSSARVHTGRAMIFTMNRATNRTRASATTASGVSKPVHESCKRADSPIRIACDNNVDRLRDVSVPRASFTRRCDLIRNGADLSFGHIECELHLGRRCVGVINPCAGIWASPVIASGLIRDHLPLSFLARERVRCCQGLSCAYRDFPSPGALPTPRER